LTGCKQYHTENVIQITAQKLMKGNYDNEPPRMKLPPEAAGNIGRPYLRQYYRKSTTGPVTFRESGVQMSAAEKGPLSQAMPGAMKKKD
jgi:hypothetical protein